MAVLAGLAVYGVATSENLPRTTYLSLTGIGYMVVKAIDRFLDTPPQHNDGATA